MSDTRKVSESKMNLEKDKTDWERVLSEAQDVVDHKSYSDAENPVLYEGKFKKQVESSGA
ncbi:hypothetical protein [Microbulbifer agarilyticus]